MGRSIHRDLLSVTTPIEVDLVDGSCGIGTGFFVRQKTPDGSVRFLVTNKHVIEGSLRGRFFGMRARGDAENVVGRREFVIDEFEKVWFPHPDPSVDIAVSRMPPRSADVDDVDFLGVALPEERVPTMQQLEELDAIEEIVLLGYPDGIYDALNCLPIVRRGITASQLQVDFEGRAEFLVDAAIFPGSSGSPVFTWEQAMTIVSRGGMTFTGNVGVPRYFVGVVSHVGVKNEIGELTFVQAPTSTRAAVRFEQVLNLGVVIKAPRVFEATRACLEQEK